MWPLSFLFLLPCLPCYCGLFLWNTKPRQTLSSLCWFWLWYLYPHNRKAMNTFPKDPASKQDPGLWVANTETPGAVTWDTVSNTFALCTRVITPIIILAGCLLHPSMLEDGYKCLIHTRQVTFASLGLSFILLNACVAGTASCLPPVCSGWSHSLYSLVLGLAMSLSFLG